MASHRGHVLWVMLVLLGLLAELAVTSLQQAARSSLMTLTDERRQRRDSRADAIAMTLEALPLPSLRDAVPGSVWGPQQMAGDMSRQGCGQPLPGSYLQPCDLPVAGDLMAPALRPAGWHWQLLRLADDEAASEGTDPAAFPGLRPQQWQLQVVVTGRGGESMAWRYRYCQQAAP